MSTVFIPTPASPTKTPAKAYSPPQNLYASPGWGSSPPPAQAKSGSYPDYLTDPRLPKVAFMALKRHVKSRVPADELTGELKAELDGCTTKFAVVSIAEKRQIYLDEVLDTLGPMVTHVHEYKSGDMERMNTLKALERAEREAQLAREQAERDKIAAEEAALKKRLADQAQAEHDKFKQEQEKEKETFIQEKLQQMREEKEAAERAAREKIEAERRAAEKAAEEERLAALKAK